MGKHICLASPHMSDEGYELEYIHDAFNKNWIAPLGENVNEFERAVKEYTGANNAIALASGTSAVHLAMVEAGVGPRDTVFCQDVTFAASANPIKYLGANVVFIDSERDTWNMDPEALKKAFELYGTPKVVEVVHLYGTPAKMDEICAICNEHNVPLIEDAAEALGSEYKGKMCGTFGAFGVISFNGNKIITSSGGGMLLCDKEENAKHALKLATQARELAPWYQHEEIGYNYRLSNISAGIGRGQMKVLDKRIRRKNEICAMYEQGFADLPISVSPCPVYCKSNRWLTAIQLDADCGVTPGNVIAALKAQDIESRHAWKPLHLQPVYEGAKYVSIAESPVADDLFNRGVCLPSDTKMSDDDIQRVIDVIKSIFA